MNQQQESTRSNLSAEQLAQATAYGLAERLGDTLRRQGLILGTAESCTGGLLAGAVTGCPVPANGSTAASSPTATTPR